MGFGADDMVESGAGEEEDSVSGGNMGNGRVLYPLRAMMEDQGPAHLTSIQRPVEGAREGRGSHRPVGAETPWQWGFPLTPYPCNPPHLCLKT
jgi:hypothetical protein